MQIIKVDFLNSDIRKALKMRHYTELGTNPANLLILMFIFKFMPWMQQKQHCYFIIYQPHCYRF